MRRVIPSPPGSSFGDVCAADGPTAAAATSTVNNKILLIFASNTQRAAPDQPLRLPAGAAADGDAAPVL